MPRKLIIFFTAASFNHGSKPIFKRRVIWKMNSNKKKIKQDGKVPETKHDIRLLKRFDMIRANFAGMIGADTDEPLVIDNRKQKQNLDDKDDEVSEDEDSEEEDENKDDDDESNDGFGGFGEMTRNQFRQIYQLDPHHEDYESGDLCESNEDGEEEQEIDIDFGTGEDWDDRPTFNEFYGMED